MLLLPLNVTPAFVPRTLRSTKIKIVPQFPSESHMLRPVRDTLADPSTEIAVDGCMLPGWSQVWGCSDAPDPVWHVTKSVTPPLPPPILSVPEPVTARP